ncbi:YmaF family protein [Thermoanaerobacterium sp. DL9XJH110]|jgi:hypothetical protein|uniref:YmaF family protein n=1 Tax=Thermoanaerobacterium sp. DL9XJH110 TaxID=3386643 RepID=UPI003BB7CA99
MPAYDETDKTRRHVHSHSGLTSCNDGHCHMHIGITGTPIATTVFRRHYHEIEGITTFSDGHFHYLRTSTRPSVLLPGGYHTHFFSFSTSFNDGHEHRLSGFVEAVKS